MNWLFYFLGTLIVSSSLSLLVVKLRDKTQRELLKRLGGVAIVISLIVGVLSVSELELTLQLKGLLCGLLGILIFGILDDFFSFSWKAQLTFQFLIIAVLILWAGFSVEYITGPFEQMWRMDSFRVDLFGLKALSVMGSLFVFFWFLLIINAINWADGINGLSGCIGMLGGVALFLVSIFKEVDQPAIAILAIIFIAAVLGFWWNNFPKGRIEAGTSGSYAIGFFLAATSIMAGTKIATALIVLIVPLIDFLWVILERYYMGWPITKRDERHLHYKLRKCGWSDSAIVARYFVFVTILFLGSLIVSGRNEKIGIILIESFFVLFFIYKISRNVRKKEKYEAKD